ncbi:hypothetical protein [Chondrinema litorale]|uniref:hypothetical protein n=1 Tax=Chondrinema litorale TaxID=2994555 RepID=UPI002543CAA9|nr:hypothetical protein [Chondrinema litorale]UZR95304.1 hypothetical protein OQ292_05655 [Chondrinema litorale]
MQLKYTNREVSEMSISDLMKVINNPSVVEISRKNARDSLDALIKEHYIKQNAFSPINTLSKCQKNSLIKLWVVFKNSKKTEGWVERYYSIDYPHERELFKDQELIETRLKNENIHFVKNFYGYNKPLTGYKKLYDLAMNYYRQGRVLHMKFYLNTVYEQQENGEFMPKELYGWSIDNSYKQYNQNNDSTGKIITMI